MSHLFHFLLGLHFLRRRKGEEERKKMKKKEKEKKRSKKVCFLVWNQVSFGFLEFWYGD